jgi:hypothetical protein
MFRSILRKWIDNRIFDSFAAYPQNFTLFEREIKAIRAGLASRFDGDDFIKIANAFHMHRFTVKPSGILKTNNRTSNNLLL